ncbi:protein of unknown function DUF1456 [Alkaliphilus metalliredigens QYMF]|uniref:Cytoplasmic protein n=1 Tax=Alkaliphilus metalliredigens (strain QYMF) TaxID=293826 RepID=A6TTS4_ALKMQ|nr:DUF1456 family protein [Alkaliphilus metalliredigens]ABR49592.1 protein of unknown function DUF1456 [Alkaliphilus metalliredigens QYMF]
MNNNEILIRLSDALDIKNTAMVEIFKLGGAELTEEEVRKMLIKSKDSFPDEVEDQEEAEEKEENIKCDNSTLESFLNGFIVFRRGKQDPKPGQPERPVLAIKNNEKVNNIMLKKLKIALSFSSADMLDIFEEAGVIVSKGELSDLFRKEGHKHYKECSDKYARGFLKGLEIENRD